MDEKKIPMQEIFVSLEGEGPAVGTPTIFVRVAGCNIRCLWCDTKESWEAEGKPEWTKDEIVTYIDKLSKENPNSRRLSITGGNPLLYKETVLSVIRELAESHQTISKFNLEHPGIQLGATDEEIKEEREFLGQLAREYLIAQLKNNSPFVPRNDRELSINIDVKLAGKSRQEARQVMENHARLIPHALSLPLDNGHLTIILKYVLGDVCDLQNLEECLWIIRRYTNHNTSLNPEEFIGIVRSKDNVLDSYLVLWVVDALKRVGIFKDMRLNSNLHIFLGMK